MKRFICILLISSILFCGCAGTDPNPIAIYRPGDEKKSCSVLKAEVANIDKQITIKQAQKKHKDTNNLFWGAAGCFLIVPWAFMDLKGSEKTEISALQQRKDALLMIATEKNCEF